MTDLKLDTNGLSFTAINPTAKESKVISPTVNIKAKLDTQLNISNIIKRLKFRDISDSGKKLIPKIKKDGSRKLKLKLEPVAIKNNIGINNNGGSLYDISIPLSLKSKKKLDQDGITSINSLDTLVLPVIIDIKTGDSLDLNLSGLLRQKLNITTSTTSVPQVQAGKL